MNIDIEEPVDAKPLKALLIRLKSDWPNLELSMSPIVSPAEAAFDLKKFLQSPESTLVSFYCLQMYQSLAYEQLESFVDSHPGLRYDQIIGTLSSKLDGEMRMLQHAYLPFWLFPDVVAL